MKKLPSQKYLKECFDYDSKTGLLIWKHRPRTHFSCARIWKSENTKRTNKKAGLISSYGYLLVIISGVAYYAHRIVWIYVHGKEPTGQIDHINHIKTDNRIKNLRDTSHFGNQQNASIRKDNKSGVTGVRWNVRDEIWTACITVNRKVMHIGSFKNKNDAIIERKMAEYQYDFHANHGRAPSKQPTTYPG